MRLKDFFIMILVVFVMIVGMVIGYAAGREDGESQSHRYVQIQWGQITKLEYKIKQYEWLLNDAGVQCPQWDPSYPHVVVVR